MQLLGRQGTCRNAIFIAVYLLKFPDGNVGPLLIKHVYGRYITLYHKPPLLHRAILGSVELTLDSKTFWIKGGRVMIAFFVNYSTVAFPLHLPTLKRQQFFGAVANSLGKNSYFPLPLDVRRCVAPTGEEVDARQRGVN